MSSGNTQELQSLNHFPLEEYRVTRDGKIETRLLDCGFEQESEWRQEREWREVSAEQLSNHVRRNTAVARWAERNLGWRRLLWACVGEGPASMKSVAGQHDGVENPAH
jgi:hypothetical protein